MKAAKVKRESAKLGGEGLRIEYLALSEIQRFDKNPKKHDIGALVASIRRYGFRDAPIFDATLGALVAGHGRLKALENMRGGGEPAPNGVRVEGGEWLVPVQLGVDAKSAEEARAFLVDHNALTISGGDFDGHDLVRLFDPVDLGDLLTDLGSGGDLPVTIDGDDLDELVRSGGDWKEADERYLTMREGRAGVAVRPLLLLEQVDVMERAILKTGEQNRAKAIEMICRAYLDRS